MNNTNIDDTQISNTPPLKPGLSSILGRMMGSIIAMIWRWGSDRQVIAAFVGRYSAHGAILAVALLAGLLGQLALSPIAVSNISADGIAISSPGLTSVSQPAIAEVVATPTAPAATSAFTKQMSNQMHRAVFRQAQPRTTIPERVRLEVITYTVQSGDTIFGIAEYFELSPYTIVWANMEILQGAPWLIQPGLTIFILPVDGAYHTVAADETVDAIAEQYEVTASALYNVWNDLSPAAPLREGTLLVVPDGVGEDFDWEPPPPPAMPLVGSASASWGACGATSVSGPGATGWFILPTGSRAVSGWYFHDWRNPTHGGLDYTCHLGDPIYAADNGVVVFAGWGGGYGNLVRVRHGNGYETYYAHFSAFAVGCGQPVYQGQVLGYCGSTGWSTGPHLHYEIRYNGVPQDPQLYE